MCFALSLGVARAAEPPPKKGKELGKTEMSLMDEHFYEFEI